MQADEVVELSQQLPEVVLKEHTRWTSITFRGKGFAWVNHAEDTAMIKSTHLEREALVGSDPDTFSPGWASTSTAWVSVQLHRADPEEIFEILAEGWRMTATKRAALAFDEALGLSGSGP